MGTRVSRNLTAILFLVLLVIIGSHSAPSCGTTLHVDFGDPIEGIDADIIESFEQGRESFRQVVEIGGGLGPGFNARSCAECHSSPALGGSSTVTAIRFSAGHKELPGGSSLQRFSINPEACQEIVPIEATVVAGRLTTPIFGAGLIASISDADIEEEEERQTQSKDAINGRAAHVIDVATGLRRVGRFGWKAQQATLSFGAEAFLNEMGVTNPLFPKDTAPNGDNHALQACDQFDDLESTDDDGEGIGKVNIFMRLLAPPSRGTVTAQVHRGEDAFRAIGCAVCHRPEYRTGRSEFAALRYKNVRLFSDLLLHDVGTGDGIRQADARAFELRTPPLWGLRARQLFMHDGATFTLAGAIDRHAGEAARVTQRFRSLSSADTADLLAFLKSL
ncbi:MAG: c-type cytochrome [Pseudomonadota bacterium]|nr:c-type cytochrome [Gammaproteobacteria bacterium]MDQ3583227.1 c-type cytochrome [Pseudomonadota bacterium]